MPCTACSTVHVGEAQAPGTPDHTARRQQAACHSAANCRHTGGVTALLSPAAAAACLCQSCGALHSVLQALQHPFPSRQPPGPHHLRRLPRRRCFLRCRCRCPCAPPPSAQRRRARRAQPRPPRQGPSGPLRHKPGPSQRAARLRPPSARCPGSERARTGAEPPARRLRPAAPAGTRAPAQARRWRGAGQCRAVRAACCRLAAAAGSLRASPSSV